MTVKNDATDSVELTAKDASQQSEDLEASVKTDSAGSDVDAEQELIEIDTDKADKSSEQKKSAEDEPEVIEGQAESKQLLKSVSDSEEGVVEVQTSDLKPRMVGYIVIFIVFGCLMGWSFFAPLDSAAYAPGFVTVESYRKTIQHLEGGIVKEIHTKDGELVSNGDLLLVLDDTQFKAQLEILEAQYIAALALSGRLEAERDRADAIQFAPYLLERSSDPEVQEVTRIQEQVFNSRKTAREGEIDVLKQRIEQLREQVNGLNQQQKSERKQIKLFNEEIVEYKALLKKGFTDKTRMRDMERRVAELEGNVGENTSAISSAKIKIGETKLEIIQIHNRHQLEVAELLSQTVTQVNDLRERRLAIEDKLERTNIIAQNSGMVIGMSVHTIGAVIGSGKPILEIVPQGENLIIEAQVSPNDIDRVQTGLISEVRFSAFNDPNLPVIEGEVITVSADSLTDENTNTPFYLARIKVTPEGYENLGELKLLPGMPADTLIKTGERTLFEYLIKPIKTTFERSFKED